MRYVILANNRATIGRMKALYDEMRSQGMDVHAILGCSAWDSDVIPTTHRIQAQMGGDDNENMALTTCAYAIQLPSHLRDISPDVAIIHGDRYEQLGAALICSYMGIKIAHTEGGDRSGSIDDRARWAISALADIHLPVTWRSAGRLWEAYPQSKIYIVGSTGIDLVREWEEQAEPMDIKYPYVVVLQHPDVITKESITPVIRAVLDTCGSYRIIWVNANVDPGSKKMMKEVHKYDVEFVKNLPNEEFFRLLKGASALIGNSSSFIKEACFLGKRAVIVGSRQTGREMGDNAIKVENTTEDISRGIEFVLANGDCERSKQFGGGCASLLICDIFKHLERSAP